MCLQDFLIRFFPVSFYAFLLLSLASPSFVPPVPPDAWRRRRNSRKRGKEILKERHCFGLKFETEKGEGGGEEGEGGGGREVMLKRGSGVEEKVKREWGKGISGGRGERGKGKGKAITSIMTK